MGTEELTQIDYQILKYINKFDSISKEQILNHFNNKFASVEYRLSLLNEPDYRIIGRTKMPLINSSYVVEEFDTIEDESHITHLLSKNTFHISPLGKKTLQDYQLKRKSEKRSLWIKNAWLPIIVSIFTTLAIDGLKLLLPLIQVWLSNTLK